MSRTKQNPEEIVATIVGNSGRTEQTQATKKQEPLNYQNTFNNAVATMPTKKNSGRISEMEKPVTVSVVIDGEDYQKLQKYVNKEKENGNRGAAISKITRALLKDWIDKNC